MAVSASATGISVMMKYQYRNSGENEWRLMAKKKKKKIATTMRRMRAFARSSASSVAWRHEKQS
jgi:hypothetical protein